MYRAVWSPEICFEFKHWRQQAQWSDVLCFKA